MFISYFISDTAVKYCNTTSKIAFSLVKSTIPSRKNTHGASVRQNLVSYSEIFSKYKAL